MKKGSKMTDEQKKKISESGKNAWNLERRKKMSDEYKGENNPMYGKTHSVEARKKISIGNAGKTMSVEARKKISISTSGEKNHNYGKKMADEQRAKISKNHADVSGENNPAYKHGRSGTKEFEAYRSAKRRQQKSDQTPELTEIEQNKIHFIYELAATMADVNVDHYQPLSKGGLHHPDNLQILDTKLNLEKKDKWPLSIDEQNKYCGLRI